MAQIQPPTSTSHAFRPTTPQTRTPLKIPRLSPSRMPEQFLTANSIRNGHINLDTFSPVNQNGSFEFDRVIKRGKVLRRTKKKGAWKPSWKSTYLVLRPNLLSVYADEDETELRASVTLSDVTAVARVKKTNTEHVFGVFTPAKNYHFSCINEGATSEWVSLLRIESGTGGDEEFDLAPPDLPANQRNNPGSESTDLSAEDDLEAPGSPEMPQWSVRGNKARTGSLSNRKPSNLREYSGNEAFTTSQSDLSDALPPNGPYQSLSGSISKSKTHLEPIPDGGTLSTSRPSFQRSTSQLSIGLSQTQPQLQTKNADPNRVIRQSHILLLKSVPGTGVRQWKRVWMVLRHTSLALYKSSDEYEPLKIVQVSDLIDAAEIDPVSKSKRHCLQVIGLEKTWRFCVENETQLDGWLGALKSVISRRSRGRGQSASQNTMQGQPQASQISAFNQNSQANAVFGGSLQTTATISGQFQPGQSLSNSKPTGVQHQRPESVLDGIVEGTEEMTVH